MITMCLFISVLYMTIDKKSTILAKLDRFILLRGKPIKTLGSTQKNRDRSPYYYFLLLGIDAPVSLYQATIRNCSSFAFTFFASTAGKPQPYGFHIAGLSISLLLTQSILCQAHYKTYCRSRHRCPCLTLAIYRPLRWYQ